MDKYHYKQAIVDEHKEIHYYFVKIYGMSKRKHHEVNQEEYNNSSLSTLRIDDRKYIK